MRLESRSTNTLFQAKDDFYREQRKKEQRKETGESSWMLPSLSKRIKDDADSNAQVNDRCQGFSQLTSLPSCYSLSSRLTGRSSQHKPTSTERHICLMLAMLPRKTTTCMKLESFAEEVDKISGPCYYLFFLTGEMG